MLNTGVMVNVPKMFWDENEYLYLKQINLRQFQITPVYKVPTKKRVRSLWLLHLHLHPELQCFGKDGYQR